MKPFYNIEVYRIEIQWGERGVWNAQHWKVRCFHRWSYFTKWKKSTFVTALKTHWYETITVILRFSCRNAAGTKTPGFNRYFTNSNPACNKLTLRFGSSSCSIWTSWSVRNAHHRKARCFYRSYFIKKKLYVCHRCKTCWYERITVIFRISCRTAVGTKNTRF